MNDSPINPQSEFRPPEEISPAFAKGDRFEIIGRKHVDTFRKLCDLKPDDWVLDVGCGIGRMAVPFTTFLNEQGSYQGFDIVPKWIEWCQNAITPRYPNFRFQVADVYNEFYNPTGSYTAANYAFPYQSGVFDFVFFDIRLHPYVATRPGKLSE